MLRAPFTKATGRPRVAAEGGPGPCARRALRRGTGAALPGFPFRPRPASLALAAMLRMTVLHAASAIVWVLPRGPSAWAAATARGQNEPRPSREGHGQQRRRSPPTRRYAGGEPDRVNQGIRPKARRARQNETAGFGCRGNWGACPGCP